MFKDYIFFYDESGHSRKLTKNTIFAENYDDFFVSCIIGFQEKQRESIEKEYQLFEEKYKSIYGNKELKSTILKDKKYSYGFKSFKKDDISFISDYLNILIKHNVLVYISVQNKIEYLVYQLLRDYKNNLFIDADALCYCVTKAISVYRPEKVMSSIYEGKAFSKELCLFLKSAVTINDGNSFKDNENIAFKEAIMLLKDSKEIKLLDWDYETAFEGFSLFLKEQNIETSCIVIDEEGEGKTLKAAINQGFINSFEKDSNEEFGIRMSDILCGLLNGFFGSIIQATKYETIKQTNKKLLDNKWFELNDDQIECYRKLRTVIVNLHNSWHKTYCSYYCDVFLYLICLLNFISDKGKKELEKTRRMNGEYLNSYVCQSLEKRFSTLRSKLKKETANIEDGFFYNFRGAKQYIDSAKRVMINLPEGKSVRYYVLSAGIFWPTKAPTITIKTDKGPVSFDLPNYYFDWAFNLVAYANMGIKVLPRYVVFGRENNKYYYRYE